MASASSDVDQASIPKADPSNPSAAESSKDSIGSDIQSDGRFATVSALSALSIETKGEEDAKSAAQSSRGADLPDAGSQRTTEREQVHSKGNAALPVIDAYNDEESDKLRNANRATAPDASTQFPSPSSGFVPPVTQEDFQLHSVPASASKAGRRKSQTNTPTAHKARQQSVDRTSKGAASRAGEATSASSSPRQERRTQALRESSSSSVLSSSSSSSSPFDDGNSQAISARSSPSTVAPPRRRSSASPMLESSTSQQDFLEPDLIPLKIRDYAFDEVDPRHVGARDITAPSPREDRFRLQAEEEEEEELGEQEGGEMYQEQGGLPLGLYHAAYAFAAESEHELSVQAGERLRLVGHVEGGWAIVIRIKEGEEDVVGNADDMSSDGKGLVPEAYLEWIG